VQEDIAFVSERRCYGLLGGVAMTAREAFPSRTNPIKRIWAKARDVAIDNIGATLGGLVATAAITGAVAAWAALKAWVVPEIPAGLVIASVSECRDLKGGWSAFDAAGGRFIIGAGTHPPNPGVTKLYEAFTTEGASPRTGFEKASGGEEKHLLTKGEMPKHDHANAPYVYLLQSDGNFTISNTGDYTSGQPNLGSVGKIQSEGNDQPHNIIPPYVALYFCKKT
jgi:hypothetical protein